MPSFALTRLRPGSAPEVVRVWGYRPTAGHLRETLIPEEAVQHLATHEAYAGAEAAYELTMDPPGAAG